MSPTYISNKINRICHVEHKALISTNIAGEGGVGSSSWSYRRRWLKHVPGGIPKKRRRVDRWRLLCWSRTADQRGGLQGGGGTTGVGVVVVPHLPQASGGGTTGVGVVAVPLRPLAGGRCHYGL